MDELTFAQRDELEASRQAKRREVVERLARVLAKEFSVDELRFIWTFPGDAVRIEAFEQARTRTRR